MELQYKYDVLLCAFIGAIMVQSRCSKDEAMARVATLCTITEQQLFISKGAAKA